MRSGLLRRLVALGSVTGIGAALAADPAAPTEPARVETAYIPDTPIPGMAPDGTAMPELVEQLRKVQVSTFPDPLLPMGVWLRAGGGFFYSYVDAEAGPSVAGEVPFDGTSVHVITRTTKLGGMTVLTDAERIAAGLPVEPTWVKGYGPQPPRGSEWGAWRNDPQLVGRFHPDYQETTSDAVSGTRYAAVESST